MKGLLLMTDNSCNKFRYRILKDNTFFFSKKEILLKTIKAVHRFGICSSVWCRAKIFDHDQAAFRSDCLHCSFMYAYRQQCIMSASSVNTALQNGGNSNQSALFTFKHRTLHL